MTVEIQRCIGYQIEAHNVLIKVTDNIKSKEKLEMLNEFLSEVSEMRTKKECWEMFKHLNKRIKETELDKDPRNHNELKERKRMLEWVLKLF